jgi:peptidoglycan/LPS O-acetylase OafA/YrhL
MMDASNAREPLTSLFQNPQLTLGGLAVDGFFLLSGYLIAQSMTRTRSLRSYLERRVLRIYPAFIVAYILSVFLLGPIVGAHPLAFIPETVVRLIFLQPPMIYPGQLPHRPWPFLNGAMWTIAYEFRCYLMVAVLGLTGLLERRRVVLAATILGVAATIATTYPAMAGPLTGFSHRHGLMTQVFGLPLFAIPLTTAFLIGVCVYLYREAVLPAIKAPLALFCTLCLAALLYRDPHFGEAALTTLGAASLFWLAFKAQLGPLQRINDDWDVSYGVYLYGWPIATWLRWEYPDISPWVLAPATLILALGFGAASWWGVEVWTKDLGRSRQADAALGPAPAEAAASPVPGDAP